MYKVIDHSQHAHGIDKTRNEHLAPTYVCLSNWRDNSAGLFRGGSEIHRVETEQSVGIQRIKSCFEAEKLETNLLSISVTNKENETKETRVTTRGDGGKQSCSIL
jgi:hypothetical protein